MASTFRRIDLGPPSESGGNQTALRFYGRPFAATSLRVAIFLAGLVLNGPTALRKSERGGRLRITLIPGRPPFHHVRRTNPAYVQILRNSRRLLGAQVTVNPGRPCGGLAGTLTAFLRDTGSRNPGIIGVGYPKMCRIVRARLPASTPRAHPSFDKRPGNLELVSELCRE
jgi:hypothetical protein